MPYIIIIFLLYYHVLYALCSMLYALCSMLYVLILHRLQHSSQNSGHYFFFAYDIQH
jgi:hypothetical protein